ncbi:MAG: hypothetical protein HY865_12460 [Chloroflexi bacterium]|nr:hypothetical protein [Chloroflexota bacterium]
MKQKYVFIILGAVGLVFGVFCLVGIGLAVRTARGLLSTPEAVPMVLEVTSCDEDISDLCVVNFGANNLNRMVINFLLPDEEYAAFYVKAKYRDTVSVYVCEANESNPMIVRCTGVRTPLGEMIDIEIYTTDEDSLIARGTFLVSAIAIPTPISLPTEVSTPPEIPPATEAPVATVPPEEVPTEPPFGNEELPHPPAAPFITEEYIPYPEDEPTPEFTP